MSDIKYKRKYHRLHVGELRNSSETRRRCWAETKIYCNHSRFGDMRYFIACNKEKLLESETLLAHSRRWWRRRRRTFQWTLALVSLHLKDSIKLLNLHHIMPSSERRASIRSEISSRVWSHKHVSERALMPCTWRGKCSVAYGDAASAVKELKYHSN